MIVATGVFSNALMCGALWISAPHAQFELNRIPVVRGDRPVLGRTRLGLFSQMGRRPPVGRGSERRSRRVAASASALCGAWGRSPAAEVPGGCRRGQLHETCLLG